MEALLNVGCKAAKISYLQQKFILPALAVMPIVTFVLYRRYRRGGIQQ
jgi:hypothetical protein